MKFNKFNGKIKSIVNLLLFRIFLQQKITSRNTFMKKRFLLSLSLAASLLYAEDNGFFMSAGYQIGEAVQTLKNTGELKNLNDKYEQLNQYLIKWLR